MVCNEVGVVGVEVCLALEQHREFLVIPVSHAAVVHSACNRPGSSSLPARDCWGVAAHS